MSVGYGKAHAMSGNQQADAQPEPGHEASKTWPSSSVTVHMARGADLARRRDREAGKA